MKTTTPKQSEYLDMLVYGRYGSGKTPFVATADDHEDMQDVLFVAFEPGFSSIRDRDLTVIEIDKFDEFDKVYQYLHRQGMLRRQGNDEKLLEMHNKFFDVDDNEPELYNTVILDSFTEAQMLLKYQILSFDYKDNLSDETPEMGWDEWGQLKERTKRLVTNFQKLEMNTLFTALLSENKDEITGEISREPMLEGSSSDEVPGVFDLVLCMKSAEEEGADSKILTRDLDGYHARDRFGELDTVILDPTVPDIYDSIFNK